MIVSEHQVDDGFSDHSQFHEARVGIRIEVKFRLFPKLRQDREVFLQKRKVAVHHSSPPSCI